MFNRRDSGSLLSLEEIHAIDAAARGTSKLYRGRRYSHPGDTVSLVNEIFRLRNELNYLKGKSFPESVLTAAESKVG